MLDAQQHQVAEHYGENALILAGAGAGKTRTIIERAAALVQAGAEPNKMLLVTFTNKAAKEMRTRLIDIFVERHINQDLPTITTFHQFGFRLIKKNFLKLGYTENPTVLSAKEASNLWLDCYYKYGMTKDILKKNPYHENLPEMIANEGIYIDGNDTSRVDEFLKKHHSLKIYQNELFSAVLEYQITKMEQNVLDFSDLLSQPLMLLSLHKDIQQRVSKFLIDVVVDEAQDNNNAQYELLKLITNTGSVPTLMIGDGDQSIYEWRGAAPNNLQRFIDEFKAQFFALERNYRSTKDIVEASQGVVENNRERIDKTAYSITEKEQAINADSFSKANIVSPSIIYTETKNAYEMGKEIANHIVKKKKAGEDISKIVILYRTQRMGFFIDKCLSNVGISTVMYAGTGLMERQETLLAVAALRLKVNPKDASAFKRIANTIKGLGKMGIEDIVKAGKNQKKSLLEVTGLKPKISQGLTTLKEQLNDLKRPDEILGWMKKYMSEALRKEAVKKIREEIKRGTTNLEDNPDNEDFQMKVFSNLTNYYNNIQSVEDSIKNQIEEGDYINDIWEVLTDLALDAPQSKKDKTGIILSTFHSFKGLESEEIHIAGFTDGLMPLRDKDHQIANAEEERRLAYVAMTRAEKTLFLHHINFYDMVSGGTSMHAEKCSPSIYLKELTEGLRQKNQQKNFTQNNKFDDLDR